MRTALEERQSQAPDGQASVPYVCRAKIQEELIACWRWVSLPGWRCLVIHTRGRTKCTSFLPENLRPLSQRRFLFSSQAILCWPRATSLTSCVIPAPARITFYLCFRLLGSRSSSRRRGCL